MFKAHSMRVLDLKPIKILIPYFSPAFPKKTDSNHLKKCGLGGGGARPLSAALNVYWEQAVWEFVSSLDNDAKLAKWPHLLKPPPHTHSLLLSGKRQASSQKPVQIKDRWQKSWAAVLKFENQMLRIKTEKVQIENIPIYLSEDLSEPFLIKFQQIYLHWE